MALVSGDIARAADVLDAIRDAGVVKGVRITNTGDPIGTTPSNGAETNLSHYALTGLTLDTTRYYLYRAQITWTKTAASDTYDIFVRANTPLTGAIVGSTPVAFGAGQTIGWTTIDLIVAPQSGWTSLHLSVKRATGSGTLSWFGMKDNNVRAWAYIQHIGRRDVNWTDV